MEIPHFKNGKTARTEVDATFLGDQVKSKTLRAAVLMYQANQRAGTHSTLTRAEVARSKRALFKQKGTGRARVRHPQATQCRGGGIAFGPKPRDYSYAMPKKARRLALRSALLSKFQDGEVVLCDRLGGNDPKTKELAKLLKGVGAVRSCLIVDSTPSSALVLSARNLQKVTVSSARDLNALDVMKHRHLLLSEAALSELKEIHANG
jgi:large subunit ribosomal protein L4